MDIVRARDYQLTASPMKTNRKQHSGKSAALADDNMHHKSDFTAVKSLPAVRPFSGAAVQKKAYGSKVAQEETDQDEISFTRFTVPPAVSPMQPPVQGGFFSGLKEKLFGKKQQAAPEEIEMAEMGQAAPAAAMAPAAPAAAPAPGRWERFKAGASSFGNSITSGASSAFDKVKNFANRDENINRKNTALNSGLPMALTGAGIHSAVDTAQRGFLQQGKSAGSTVAGSLGIVGGGITGVMGAADMAGAIQTGDTRRGLMGAADVASGGLSIASGALSIAGTTGAAIPGLGIASAGLDTVVQGGKGIYAHKQMNKLAAMQNRIQSRNGEGFGQLSPGQGYTGDLKKQYALLNIAKEAMNVRRKQRNRAGINALGSAVETAGHSTVVGAGVTGIGAAVGMGLVAGGKGIKAIAGLVRGAKQKMIDKGWIGKGKDDERTSENKEKRAQAFIDNVMENHDDPEVHEAMDALGANKEQMALLKEGKLPRADIYKLYKTR